MNTAAILNHKSAFRWLLCSVIILHTVAVVSGQLQTVLRDCCALGAEWGIQDPSRPENGCYNAPGPGRTSGIAQEHLPSCLSMAFICCLKHRRNDMCELGKEKALIGDRCLPGNAEGGEYSKDCCEACKLGLIYGNIDSTCRLMGTVDIGFPWGNAFLDCCGKASVNGQNPDSTLAPPTPGVIDHCLQYSGGPPCAHTCINTHDGFICQCHEGYRLNPADQRSCLPGEDSCNIANPCEQLCTDTGTNVECGCYPGYILATDLVHCEDFDECHSSNNDCDPSLERCINRPGTYICQSRDGTSRQPNAIPSGPNTNSSRTTICTSGYEYVSRTGTCHDVDECQTNNHTCGTRLCHNTIGSYTCLPRQETTNCPPGYKYSDQVNFCVDVDECLDGVDICNHAREFCLNIQGSYECQLKTLTTCPAGYKYNTVAEICEDVDECTEGSHVCNPLKHSCLNAAGTYRCVPVNSTRIEDCTSGFRYDSASRSCMDVNECQVGAHNCLPTQRCDNTLGSFSCIRLTGCGTGYTLNAHTNHCEDDNECELGNHNCGPTYDCHNSEGSFRCVRKSCPRGRLEPDGRCVPVSCQPGMEPNLEGQCIDINECNAGIVCRQNQRCINTEGSFQCQNLLACGAGYEINDAGNQCLDIDECRKVTHDCKPDQVCTNRPGGYTCQCRDGYTFNSQRNCEDIDECSRFGGRVCSSNAECQNTLGSYICRCKPGFKQSEDKNCADINECDEISGLCQHGCINTWGSYQCTCKSGFKLNTDGRSCEDIDECVAWQGQGKLCIGNCVNQPGSYTCACPHGYKLSTDQRTCQDIDECSQGICSAEHEVCLNTRGAYKCNRVICPQNYIRDKDHKNRCKHQSPSCKPGDKACLEQPLAYSFNYITFVSNLPIGPTGQVNLFTMRGPQWTSTVVDFELVLKSSRSATSRDSATREDFLLQRTNYNQAVVSLIKTLTGPQELELELTMRLHHNNVFGGVAVAKIFIFVSEYEY